MNWETRWNPEKWNKVLLIDKAGQEAAAKEIAETASEAAIHLLVNSPNGHFGNMIRAACLKRLENK